MRKRISILSLIILVITICLTGCGNKNWGIGNYTFTHCHYFDGVEGQCVTINSWHDNELGCEIHTPTGGIYLSEGTYQLYESDKVCPYCGKGKVNNMWFWLGLALVLLICAIVIFVKKSFDYNFGWSMTGVVACILALCFILAPIETRTEYIKFEKTFEIQKAQFEAIAESNAIDDSKYVYVVDAINSNKELAEYQASKATWRFASALPDRVFDIEPIGVK